MFRRSHFLMSLTFIFIIIALIARPPVQTASLSRAQDLTATPSPERTESAASTASATDTADYMFVSDFTDNSQGWDLSSDENLGGATITNGQLIITAKSSAVTIAVPNLRAKNFYLEAVVAFPADHYEATTVGLWVGDLRANAYHMFEAGYRSNKEFRVVYHDVGKRPQDFTELFATVDTPLWNVGEKGTLGLEAQNGSYTFYLNGIAMKTVQITPYSDELGVTVWNLSPEKHMVYFDKISVRQSRK